MKAVEWLKVAEGTENRFDRFGNFWIASCCLYKPIKEKKQRDKISRHIFDAVDEATAGTILSQAADSVARLVEGPVGDPGGAGYDTGALCAQFHATDDAKEKLRAVMLIAYKIRCNLEHGLKSPTRDRDRDLCQYAADVVEQYLGHILQ